MHSTGKPVIKLTDLKNTSGLRYSHSTKHKNYVFEIEPAWREQYSIPYARVYKHYDNMRCRRILASVPGSKA